MVSGCNQNHSGPFQWGHKERCFLAGSGLIEQAERCYQKQRGEEEYSASTFLCIFFIPLCPISQTYRDARGLIIKFLVKEQGREKQRMNLKAIAQNLPHVGSRKHFLSLYETPYDNFGWSTDITQLICMILLIFFFSSIHSNLQYFASGILQNVKHKLLEIIVNA